MTARLEAPPTLAGAVGGLWGVLDYLVCAPNPSVAICLQHTPCAPTAAHSPGSQLRESAPGASMSMRMVNVAAAKRPCGA
jgi:hypothetical protein